MKRFFTLVLTFLAGAMACQAQEGFRVNGKFEGLPDGPLLLVSYEKGTPDTLGIVQTQQGAFTFSGKVDGVITAYITTADQKGSLPLMLENTEFTVNIGNGKMEIKGGEQQEIYNQFLAINMNMMSEQKKMKEDLQIAQQEQNAMKLTMLKQQLVKMQESILTKEQELLKKYSDSYASAYKVVSGMQKQDPEVVKANFELLGENARRTSPGVTVATMLAQYAKVSVGSVLPNFKAPTPEGGTIALADVKGKIKLIDFWASWCAPCRRENPNVRKIYEKYHEEGLEIVSISLDKDPQAWVKAIKEDELGWYQCIDPKSQLARVFFVRSVPYTILLDENNTIIAKNLRGPALQKKIAELLKK